MEPDAMLARLDVLEGLWRADLGRRPTLHKPAQQRQWQAEIAQLRRQRDA
jgi:hypothetical protein